MQKINHRRPAPKTNQRPVRSAKNSPAKASGNGRQTRSTTKMAPIQVAPNTRRGEVMRAKRMLVNDVNLRSTQHIIDVPVNKSPYNGNNGQQVTQSMLKKARYNPEAVRIITLGGLNEIGIGKNMTLIEYQDEMVMIDMGTLFADNNYPGVNYMIQDISYVEQNLHKLKAIIFTHAHLDHIGGTPQLLPKFKNVPVYGTAFTIEMIKKQMEDSYDQDAKPNYQVVNPKLHQQIKVGPNLSFEFVSVTHSIPGGVALVFRTPNGVIVYSGDWRFEDKPLKDEFDMPRLVEISQKEGVDLLMNESTNIDSPGTHMTNEFAIGDNIGEVMDRFPNSRIIVSCFSSQIHRIQLILEEAKQHGRKVAFAGYSMINNVETALRTNEIKIPKDTVVKIEDISKMSDSKVTIICTGSQGELNAVLSRMVTGAHRFIKIKQSDVIIFSSNPIPGNEPNVVATVDGLIREGATVIQNGRSHLHGIGPLHVSGHAYYEDHVKFVTTLNPRNYMPIHGQFVMLEHNAEMAENIIGLSRKNILVCDNGDVVELLPDKSIRKNGRVKVGAVMFDAANNRVQEAVVKDRLHLSTQGIIIIVASVNKKTGRISKTPDILSRGFVYLKENEDLISRVRHYIKIKIERTDMTKVDLKQLKDELKDDLAHILYDSTQMTPIIIPVVNIF